MTKAALLSQAQNIFRRVTAAETASHLPTCSWWSYRDSAGIVLCDLISKTRKSKSEKLRIRLAKVAGLLLDCYEPVHTYSNSYASNKAPPQ